MELLLLLLLPLALVILLVYYSLLQVTVLPAGCTNNGPCGSVAGAEARVLSSIQELSKALTSDLLPSCLITNYHDCGQQQDTPDESQ